MAHRALPKYAAALLSPSCLHNLRVPAELAARFGGEEGGGTLTVLLLGPLGGKVWHAELSRREGGDREAWQLGDGWPEFVAAHGVGAGWSVVFRLERRGVATVKVFDPAGCLVRFCTPLPGVVVKERPRFIRLLDPEDLEMMKMPDKFVQAHLIESESSPISQHAIMFSRLGKFWRVELERGKPGVLRGDGWARFLMAHNVSEGNVLVFRSSNIADDVVGPSVPQGGAKQPGLSPVKMKRKYANANTGSDKKPKGYSVTANKVAAKKKPVGMAPQYSFTRRIIGFDLKSYLVSFTSSCYHK
ncbi:hypothetical protein PR202_gb27958 [Eleusine coracana subsp. coracana]|uniref:TF-B3 domain-containing protein n=1 Tax=Eleusine coracana subsp. coracana TaxID=191504 RepID=A0AAV5FT71_ELECO|nr:hypothetical protein PR202_gb27958 [Eleusine coracana subsp. coracana]